MDSQNSSMHVSRQKIKQLEQANDKLLVLRSRFLSKYKESTNAILGKVDRSDLLFKDEDNQLADPTLDAILYKRRLRDDRDTFENIYGLSYEAVLNIGKVESSILLVNSNHL